jgi:hypothetical protein
MAFPLSYIESNNYGLPLAVTSVINKCYIFQIKTDRKNPTPSRHLFVINRAFDVHNISSKEVVQVPSSPEKNSPNYEITIII